MLIKIKRGWELPERAATPEDVFLKRRSLLKAAAAGPVLLAGGGLLAACDDSANAKQEAEALQQLAEAEADPSAHLYPLKQNIRYRLDRDLTSEELVRDLGYGRCVGRRIATAPPPVSEDAAARQSPD